MHNLKKSIIIIGEKADTDTIDRLSSLPEHLISEILSKLCIDTAVKTSILSRHWRYQWTYVTRFHLTSHNLSDCPELYAFLTTVDNILQKLKSPRTNLRSFYLMFNLPNSDEFEVADSYNLCCQFLSEWFHRICSSLTERFQVSELRLGHYLCVDIQNSPLLTTMSISDSICYRTDEYYEFCLPDCIFHSKTLGIFILDTNISFTFPNYNLPNLKELSLRIYDSDRQLMRTIFKSLPSLQDLTIWAYLKGKDHFIHVSAPRLKDFTIEFKRRNSQTNVLIDAPKLEHISISINDSLVLFRFVKIPIDLLSTRLLYRGSVGDDAAILELVKAITCTRSLHLSRLCCPIQNVLSSYTVAELPTFHNLVHLSLTLFDEDDINLGIPAWILGRLKTIRVRGYIKGNEYEKEMSLLENILSKANVLEQLNCYFVQELQVTAMDSVETDRDFIKALFMLPRASSCCEIEFRSVYARASTLVDNGNIRVID